MPEKPKEKLLKISPSKQNWFVLCENVVLNEGHINLSAWVKFVKLSCSFFKCLSREIAFLAANQKASAQEETF